jgi:hypothetical protein
MKSVDVDLIERIDFEAATVRYDLSPAALKNRLRAVRETLGLETEKGERGKGYLTGQLLVVMDALDADMKRGGTQKEFLNRYQGQIEVLAPKTRQVAAPQPSRQEEQLPDGIRLLAKALVEQVAQAQRQAEPLESLKALQWAVENRCILSTNQVCALLEIRSLPKADFERHGFFFRKAGKVGPQNGWKVHKDQP